MTAYTEKTLSLLWQKGAEKSIKIDMYRRPCGFKDPAAAGAVAGRRPACLYCNSL